MDKCTYQHAQCSCIHTYDIHRNTKWIIKWIQNKSTTQLGIEQHPELDAGNWKSDTAPSRARSRAPIRAAEQFDPWRHNPPGGSSAQTLLQWIDAVQNRHPPPRESWPDLEGVSRLIVVSTAQMFAEATSPPPQICSTPKSVNKSAIIKAPEVSSNFFT